MSLIQEALKRKREEEGGTLLPMSDSVAPPSAHPMMTKPRRSRPPAAILFLRGACYLILFAGALAGLWSLFRQPNTTTVTETEVRTVLVSEQAHPVSAEPVVDPPAAEVPPEVTPPPVAPPPVAATTPPPVAPAPVVVPEVEKVVVQAPKPVPARKVVPAVTGSAVWPKISVMGVFERPDPTLSTAIIDGELEEVGTTIDGVRIAEVRANGVVFSYRGETRFVRVGRATVK